MERVDIMCILLWFWFLCRGRKNICFQKYLEFGFHEYKSDHSSTQFESVHDKPIAIHTNKEIQKYASNITEYLFAFYWIN